MSDFFPTPSPRLRAIVSPDPQRPQRPVYWLRALKALARLGKADEFSSEAAREFGAALEGDEGENSFRAFLREAGAQSLLSERPDLAAALDDFESLAAMPEGSLGQAYLALAEGDQISVKELVRGGHDLPAPLRHSPDPLRSWYRERGTALHDLHHVLTGYGRDLAGEAALSAFSLGLEPKRVWRVALILTCLAVPKRKLGRLLPYFYRAWKRGKRARIPAATPWEELLPLPLAEVQGRLEIQSSREVHPQGIWKGDSDGPDWAAFPAAG